MTGPGAPLRNADLGNEARPRSTERVDSGPLPAWERPTTALDPEITKARTTIATATQRILSVIYVLHPAKLAKTLGEVPKTGLACHAT